MNNSLRRVPALLLLLLLCGCGRGGETTEIRYYRLCERPEREPPRQSGVRAVLFAGRKGKRRRDTDHPEL